MKKYPKCSAVRVTKAYNIETPDGGMEFDVTMGGNYVGTARLLFDGNLAEVALIHVDTPKCGIGTRVYQHLYRTACRHGKVLASDTVRSPHSEGFWRKQVAKGRAVCVDQSRRGAERVDAESFALLPGRWPCRRWAMKKPCPPKRRFDLRG